VPALPVGMADFRAPTRGAPTLWHGQPAPIHRGPARDRRGQDGRATIWLQLRRASFLVRRQWTRRGRQAVPLRRKALRTSGFRRTRFVPAR
jgi:hypothetical protein